MKGHKLFKEMGPRMIPLLWWVLPILTAYVYEQDLYWEIK